MLKNLWLLAITIPALLLAGCEEPADDDDATPERTPIIVEVSPTFEQTDFFFQSSLRVEFDLVPDSATVTLTDASGASVAGTQGTESNGRVITFDPTADLTPSAGYSLTVEWSPSQPEHSPFTNNFQTGAYGGEVPEQNSIIGLTYAIDLAGATFVDPPGIGPILQSQIEGFSVLLSPLQEGTDLDAGVMHIMGAIGDDDGTNITQSNCAPTLAFTAGEDGVVGTADDAPASWDNPHMVLEAEELPLSIQGVTATIEDLLISGTFHPELTDMRGGVFAGTIDTRPLVGALGAGESETEICDLVSKTVGVDCIECPDGEFLCLNLRAEDLGANLVEGLVLSEKPCEDIITTFVETGNCDDEAAGYDEDGNGEYELCPAYVPPPAP
ncbi:MAG: Ig-like domain-containing protein [Myxococcota bacterium]|nr:Ig-like domain-containing protein [Myxococcota bacterium]